MSMGYWIVHVTVHDPGKYDAYRAKAQDAIAAFNGTYLVRGGDSSTPEGQSKARHVIVAFPDYATAKACFDSPAYQEAAEIRRASADTDFTIVEGHA